MAIQPNLLLRTKIGLGGIRLLDYPGLTYPESVLKAAPGMHPQTGRPYSRPPANTVSSAQAAAMLGTCISSTRARLHNHKVRFYFVQVGSSHTTLYWSRRKVQELVDSAAKKACGAPRGMVGWRQAVEMLPCTRSSLQRHVKNGRVRTRCLRVPTVSGMQTVRYYSVADLRKLRTYLLFCAAQESEARRRYGRGSTRRTPARTRGKTLAR